MGVEEAVNYSSGKNVKVKGFHPEPVNVKGILLETRLKQDEFVSAFGISVGTLRHWKRDDRKPQGSALVQSSLNGISCFEQLILSVIELRIPYYFHDSETTPILLMAL